MRRSIGVVLGLMAGLESHGADVGAPGSKLVLVDKLAAAGKARTVFVVRNDPGIQKGAAGDPAELAGRFEWFYTDTPSSVGGVFDLVNDGAARWTTNGTVAKYVNANAASGTPTAARVAVVKPGKLAKVASPFALSDPGGSPDLAAGPPSTDGGVTAVLSIVNGNDGSMHRSCTRFATADGSTVAYRGVAAGTGRRLVAKHGVATACPSTTATTTSSSTTTTAPPCGGGAPHPICWGSCPPQTPICAAGPLGCECVVGATPCGSATFPECDGACGPGEACQVSLDLGCTCAFQGLPCAIAGFPICDGVCPDGDECRSVSSPDGEGCLCQPAGSTCLDSSPTCGGTCPAGETCSPSAGGICLCN